MAGNDELGQEQPASAATGRDCRPHAGEIHRSLRASDGPAIRLGLKLGAVLSKPAVAASTTLRIVQVERLLLRCALFAFRALVAYRCGQRRGGEDSRPDSAKKGI